MNKLILIFACIFSQCAKPPEYVSVSDASIEKYVETIKNDHLKVLSIGGFYFKEKVEQLYLDLEYDEILVEADAYNMLTSYVKGMLAHINADAKLIPFLIKDTFSTHDISISLSYLSEDGRSRQVHLHNDQVIFSTYEKETNTLKRDHALSISL